MKILNLNDINELFAQIGLADTQGKEYSERQKKRSQLYDYLAVLKAIIRKLSSKRTLNLLDCACGRSYLSFFLNYMLQEMGQNNLHFIGVDTNKELIEKCRLTASALDFTNMEFIHSSIMDCYVGDNIDIVYSLHACDTATDQTILKGIMTNARYILSVSCCQQFTKRQMKQHPLSGITRHARYKERIVDMVSDSLRALLLEACGYKVDVFEFTSPKSTPKNILLRGERINTTEEKRIKALEKYIELADLFHVQPALVFYLLEQGALLLPYPLPNRLIQQHTARN